MYPESLSNCYSRNFEIRVLVFFGGDAMVSLLSLCDYTVW